MITSAKLSSTSLKPASFLKPSLRKLAAFSVAVLAIASTQGNTQAVVPNAGSYRGLGTKTAGTGFRKGLLTLALSAGQTFSATFANGRRVSFKGQFDAAGNSVTTVTQSGKTITVSLAGAGTGDGLTGTIQIGTLTYSLAADRNTFDAATHPAPAARYTFFFGSPTTPTVVPPGFPTGYGWAAAGITSSGKVSVVGRLGDTTGNGRPTSFSSGGFLAPDTHHYSLYTALYGTKEVYRGAKGQFAGLINFQVGGALPAGDVSGTLAWAKPYEIQSGVIKNFPFDVDVKANGSLYTPPPPGTTILPGLDALGDAQLDFKAGLISGSTITRTIRIARNNQVSPDLTGFFDKLSLSFNVNTGVFTGIFLHNSFSPNYTAYKGVVLQRQGFGRGNFVGAAANFAGTPNWAGGKVELSNPFAASAP